MMTNLRSSLSAIACICVGLAFHSCESEKSVDDTSNLQELVNINTQYVDGVVLPTYDSLSSSTINLYEAISALKLNKTDANVAKVASIWKSTRIFWEESEAFLFGPVDVMGIDPHIDTWPMVETSLQAVLNNTTIINNLNSDTGDILVSGTSDSEDGILGFHGLEYIIFRNGQVRAATDISDAEIIFALASAGDLRNQCCLIEVGWKGENQVNSTHLAFAKRISNYSEQISKFTTPYATTMKSTPNSKFASALASTAAILDGAIDIANEVYSAKIGKPYYGANDEDKNYIESKYSYNSKVDFAGNIRSIKNAYLGAISSSNSHSVSNYIQSKNATLDTEVKAAISDAINKIEAIQNFETDANSTTTLTAMNACGVLLEKLEKAKNALSD